MEKIAWEGRESKRGVKEKRKALKERVRQMEIGRLDVRVGLIQALIPLGLKQVGEVLQEEVERMAGEKGKHGKENVRWGKQAGSIYLRDQKLPIDVPRVRNKAANREAVLETYRKLQEPQRGNEQIFLQLLNGISTRRYEESAAMAPEVFGLSASSMSRKFRRLSAGYLKQLMERRLDEYDFVALYIDGKAYAAEGLVIAMGVTVEGEKVILGMEQMNAENSKSVGQFIGKLIDRGMRYEEGLLAVVDGSRGIIKALKEKLSGYVLIQRCKQHKKENVVSYLPKGQQNLWRSRMERAYGMESYGLAARELVKMHRELAGTNPSAAASLREGMLETLTLHRMGLQNKLYSLGSTNGIESVMSHLGQYTDKVDRWRNGRQIQEWAAAGLLRIEPRLRRLMGHRYLPELRACLQQRLNLGTKPEPVVEQELVAVEA